MEWIGTVQRRFGGRVFIEDEDGNELNELEHVGKSLYVGDYDALIKELNELRKDKARKQYLIDLFRRVTTFDNFQGYEAEDSAIDAAIAKSEHSAMLD